MKKIFEQLKVVELAGVLAGPSVGMFFSELGAEVIKIENSKTKGDVTRSWKLPSEDKNKPVSAYFSCVNYGKKHLFRDLKNKEHLNEINEIILESDIVLTNFKTGDDKKYGFDFESIHKLNPKTILGKISGFSHAPDRVAFDLILQAESGIMSMNGQADGPPTKMPIALIDILAGHQLKEGILCALLERNKTQLGQEVEVSLYDAALASLANQATNWLMAGHNPSRIGSLHPNIAPYGEIFKSQDGVSFTFAIGSNAQFEKLNQILKTEFHLDELFSKNQNRVQNRTELSSLLEQELLKHHFKPLFDECLEFKIPIAKIKTVKEVFEDDYSKSLILEENIDGIDTKRVKTVVFNQRRNTSPSSTQ